MKKLLCLFSLFILLISTVFRFPAFGEEDADDNSSLSFKSSIIEDNNASSEFDGATPDLFTGAMKHLMPILVPTGRNGMEPKLTLTYKNNQSNSWLGLGWQLEVDSIERSTKNGVNYDKNSYVFKTGGNTIGLTNIGNGEYRATIETGFLKFKVSTDSTTGRPTSWEVIDKSGTHYFFGQSSESRQDQPDDPAHNIAADASKVFKWCLDQEMDANGNYIKYYYFKDQGHIYLDHIDYTWPSTSIMSSNRITFVRDDGARQDAVTIYTPNFGVKTVYRLDRIDITANNNLVRSYKFNYRESANTFRTLLRGIQQLGKDGTSPLPETIMDYSPESTGFIVSTKSSLGHLVESRHYKISDFDGNGRSDILRIDYLNSQGNEYATVGSSTGSDFITTLWGRIGDTHNTIIYPADFDGDGKADIFLSYRDYISGVRVFDVALSTGANFGSVEQWLTVNAYNPEQNFVADFDGNGKADILSVQTGTLNVYLSTGSSTAGFVSDTFASKLGNSEEARYRVADFNGDGKADVLYIGSDGNLQVATYSEIGFVVSSNPWATSGHGDIPAQYAVGDINGDRKADIIYIDSNGNIQTEFSTGSAFITAMPSISMGNGDITRYKFADYDGNGMTDILFIDQSGNLSVALSAGCNFKTFSSPWGTMTWGNDNIKRYHIGDFNGDGRTDVVFLSGRYLFSSQGIPVVATAVGPADNPDNPDQASNLLIKIFNSIGGSVGISYTPSTQYSNVQLPFSVQTVSSVIRDDGNGNLAETKYGYEGGYYHITERDFRGFNHVTVTGPADPYDERKITETWFHQGIEYYNVLTGLPCTPCSPEPGKPCACYPPVPDLKGKPYHTRVTDANGSIYSESAIIYHSFINANGGYFNAVDTTKTYICDGSTTTTCNDSTSGQNKKTNYSYDGYGNVTSEQEYNSANASAPYRTIARAFTTDSTENYIVGLPKYEKIYDSSGQLVSSTTYYYDDPSDCETRSMPAGYTNQIPTHGNVTTIVGWLNSKPTGATDPEINMSYDSDGYGNLVCTRDGNGKKSRIFYDTATNTYPIGKTNDKDQWTTIQYYGINASTDKGLYGQVASVIDPNLVATTTEYDALGRKTKVIDPYGIASSNGTVSYSYNSFGSVGQQHVTVTSTIDYSTGATIWKKVFFDGFGRTIKTLSQAPDNKVISTDRTYDARGAVYISSLPYFEGLASYPTQVLKYDAVGRVTQKTNSDGTIVKSCYLNGVTAWIDPDGNKKRETRDVFGRLIQVDEYNPGTAFTSCTTDQGAPYATTIYQYDVLGNLRYVTDAEGNQTEMRYDSLRRKYYMKDPDMGQWSYSFDANNNLTSQTDANANSLGTNPIYFHYDALNRLLWKEYPKNGPVNMTDVHYTYDVAPDDAATTYPVGRLSIMSDASGTTKYYYDMLGRTSQTTKSVVNVTPSYTFKTTYDALGRPASLTYPDNETVSYAYTAGVLSSVTGTAVNYAAYNGYNAIGQPGTITYGNGIITNYMYSTSNYDLQSIVTGTTNQTLINLAYDYYPGGNIKNIVDSVDYSMTQWFEYDGLGRIQHAQTPNAASFGGVSDLFYNYSQTGNISYKEGITYDHTDSTGLHPHAVKSNITTGMTYSYDLNGNLITESTGSTVYRSITYDYDNMPQSVTLNNATTSFVYDGAGTRVKKSTSSGENIYLGKLYECVLNTCAKAIFAGDTRIATKTGSDVLYYHGDHLGSTQVVTQTGAIQNNACSKPPVRILRGTSVYNYYSLLRVAYNVAVNGDIIQARAVNFTSEPIPLNLNRPVNVTIKGGYDCGYTQQIDNSVLVNSLIISQGTVTMGNFEVMAGSYAKEKVYTIRYSPFGETLSDYGLLSVNHKYTSQEFDADTELYNYNARLYNPSIGRFISANPVVSDPTNPQALNRYSYVLNSPLRYVDPSGYDEYDSYYAYSHNIGYSDWGGSGYYNYYDQISSPYSSNSSVPYDLHSLASNNWPSYTFGYDTSTPWPNTDATGNENESRWNNNTAFVAGSVLNLLGTGAAAGEYSNEFEGYWRGINAKWYSNRWGGNQWTSARSIALRNAKLFRMGGYATFMSSTFLSVGQYRNAYQMGDYDKASKSALDVGVGFYGLIGGPFGVGAGVGYWAADLMGGFEGPPSPVIVYPIPVIYNMPGVPGDI